MLNGMELLVDESATSSNPEYLNLTGRKFPCKGCGEV